MNVFSIFQQYGNVKITEHGDFPDVLIIFPINDNTNVIDKNYAGVKTVIVDALCGEAVLRGAHVYAPGVMGMLPSVEKGDEVQVYADVTGKCKRGWAKEYTEPSHYVGTGIAEMTRTQIFSSNNPRYVYN